MKKLSSILSVLYLAIVLVLSSCQTTQPAPVINNYYYEIHVDSPVYPDTQFTVVTPEGEAVQPIVVVEPSQNSEQTTNPVEQSATASEEQLQAPAVAVSEPAIEQTQEPAIGETVPTFEQTPEIVSIPEVASTIPEKAHIIQEIGTIGPAGGTVFQFGDYCYEMAEPVYETLSFDDAKQKCEAFELNGFTDWKMPSVAQLEAIYSQLYDTFIIEIEENYYWSNELKNDDSAYVMYFGTGFSSAFFKDMDFLSLIPIREM